MSAHLDSGASTVAAAQGLRIPIRLKISLFASLCLIVLAVTLGTTVFVTASKMLNNQIQSRLEVIASGRQRLLLSYADQQLERVGLVASRTKFRQLVSDHVNGIENEEFVSQSSRILVDAMQSTEGFRAIWLADLEGQVISGTEISFSQNFATNEDFLAGRNGRHLGNPFLKEGDWHAYVTSPVTDSEGTLLGVLMVLLDISQMLEHLANNTGLGESGEVLLYTTNSGYLLPTRDALVTQPSLPNLQDLSATEGGQTDFLETVDYRNKVVKAVFVPVGFADWTLEVKMDSSEANRPITRLCVMLLLITSAVLLGGIVASTLMARVLTRPVRNLTRSAMSVADGDFSYRHDLSEHNRGRVVNDEIGDLGVAFEKMTVNLRQQRDDLEERIAKERTTRQEVERLRDNLQVSLKAEQDSRQRMEQLLLGIREAAGELSQTASQILQRTAQQSANCSQQAVVVAETAVTINELDESARKSTEHAQNVAVSASRAQQVSSTGRQAVLESITAIEGCRHQAEAIGETIGRLQSRAAVISEIIVAVQDLAEETNVLALNAAVEASRAGEHGTGFAVVAGEVKSLADQSKKSTSKVSTILAEIREATNAAVLMTEQGRASVDGTNSIIRKSEQTIETLTDTINEAAVASAQILAATRDQAGAISQINESMESTKRVSEEMLDSAQEVENLAEDLDSLSGRLQQLMQQS